MKKETIEETAIRIVEQSSSPVVCYRLLLDVLKRPSRDPDLSQAKERLDSSLWVQQLAHEQREDGG